MWLNIVRKLEIYLTKVTMRNSSATAEERLSQLREYVPHPRNQ